MASQSRSLNMNSINRGRLKQRFDLIRKLGQGTYGKVQLGINKVTGEEVALKTIKKSKIENDVDLLRIKREINIMSCCNHPNIIHIYEVFENREKIILVMEYAPGGELYDYLNERKKLNETEAKRLFSQIASAIYYCHKHYIVHRDLKLENILLDVNFNAKIADFGLSNVYGEDPLTTFCGSPLYASPEIVKGIPYHGPEVDCWSLGVLLYTLIYGSMPFDGSNFKKLVKQITTSTYYEPPQRSTASDLIKSLLTVDVSQRLNINQIVAHSWLSSTDCITISEEYCHLAPAKGEFLIGINNRSEDTLDEVSEISLLDGLLDEEKSEAIPRSSLTTATTPAKGPQLEGNAENPTAKSAPAQNVLQKLTVVIKDGAEVQTPALCNGDASGEANHEATILPETGKAPKKAGLGFKLAKTSSQPRDISNLKPKRLKPAKKALTSVLPELNSTIGAEQIPLVNPPVALQLTDPFKNDTFLDVPPTVVVDQSESIEIVVPPVATVPKKPTRKVVKKESGSEKNLTAREEGAKDFKVTASTISASTSEHIRTTSKNLEIPEPHTTTSVTQKGVTSENEAIAQSPPPPPPQPLPVDKKQESGLLREISNPPTTPSLLESNHQVEPTESVRPTAGNEISVSQEGILKTDSLKMEPVTAAQENGDQKVELVAPRSKVDEGNAGSDEVKLTGLNIEHKAPESSLPNPEPSDVKPVEKIGDESEPKPKVKLRRKKVAGNNSESPGAQSQPTRIARRNSKVISQKTAELIQNLKQETNKGTNSNNSKKIIILPSLNDVKRKFEGKKKEEEIGPQITRRSSVTIKVDQGESCGWNPITTGRKPKAGIQKSENPTPTNVNGDDDNAAANGKIIPDKIIVNSEASNPNPPKNVDEDERAEDPKPIASNATHVEFLKIDQNVAEVNDDGRNEETSNGMKTEESANQGERKQSLDKTPESSRILPETSMKLENSTPIQTSKPEITPPPPLQSISPNSKTAQAEPEVVQPSEARPAEYEQKIQESQIVPPPPSTAIIKKAASNQDVPLKPSPFQRIAKALSTKQVPPPETHQTPPTLLDFDDSAQHFVGKVNRGRSSGLKLFIPPFSSAPPPRSASEGKDQAHHLQSPPPITPKQKAVETIGTHITKIKSNDSRERLIPIEKVEGDDTAELSCPNSNQPPPATPYSRQSSVREPSYNGPIQKSRREFIIPITFEPAAASKEVESILPNHSGGVYNSHHHRQSSNLSLLTPDTADTTEDEFFDNGTPSSELLSPDYLFTSLLQRVRGLSQRIHDSEKQQYELSNCSPTTSRRTRSPSPGFNGSPRDDPITITITSSGSSPKVRRHISLDETKNPSTNTLQRRHSTYLTSPRGGQYSPSSFLTLPRPNKYTSSVISEENSTEENPETDSSSSTHLLPSESVLLQKAVHKGSKSSSSNPSQPSSNISKFFNTHLGRLYSKRTQSDSVLNASDQPLATSSAAEPPQHHHRDTSPSSSVSDRILRKSYYNRYNYNHVPNYKSTKELSANITKKLEQLLNDI